ITLSESIWVVSDGYKWWLSSLAGLMCDGDDSSSLRLPTKGCGQQDRRIEECNDPRAVYGQWIQD
ncbi:MAG: hypothetical protein VKK63_12280, partial [Synechococcus sp.]|nr:hypothetical protein [Synechococcus sp.]